ncbi:hypothetical protein PVL29_012677 [Vitis rotundifolia]|uniref:NAD-dependent epimerase/dehydratase domain-containing protein n=1 Tax=Vitis rotundifolia TaxID=103349 RepID=A0AA39DNP5_VITRO|nr:hypothetical protein PVL29_012677 [Vitis rotundifolia]
MQFFILLQKLTARRKAPIGIREGCNQKKISPLLALQNLVDLKNFQADLTDEGNFEAPIAGSDLVVHVATPIDFASQDPETVKRVIYTSPLGAVTINKLNGTGGYAVSKTLAEKAAWKFAQENSIDLVTVIPAIITGPSLTSEVPHNIPLSMSLITANESLINGMKGMQISMTHVEDVCLAHIFSKILLSSKKLGKEGFGFKHGIGEIYEQSMEYLKAKGLLQN